jgi:hypothetical protein
MGALARICRIGVVAERSVRSLIAAESACGSCSHLKLEALRRRTPILSDGGARRDFGMAVDGWRQPPAEGCAAKAPRSAE